MDGMTYREAGVDIDAASRAVSLLKKHARATFRPEVLTDIGFFGGLFALDKSRYQDPVLVASADGVGTKLKIAFILDKHDTVGQDLVHHCVNDIFTCGAEPLFFLDYFACGRLEAEVAEEVVKGVAWACGALGCALLGGETAEMPGFYAPGEYDLAGFIVGIVEKERVIDGRGVKAGDLVLGIPSSGLHTNGYSLARAAFGLRDGLPQEEARRILETYYPELGRTLGEELLEVHRCYYPLLKDKLAGVKAMAHITGGGLVENLPRVLPAGLSILLKGKAWEVPPVFRLIQKLGRVPTPEMYRTFNMGLGYALICAPEEAGRMLKALEGAQLVGQVIAQDGPARVIIEEPA